MQACSTEDGTGGCLLFTLGPCTALCYTQSQYLAHRTVIIDQPTWRTAAHAQQLRSTTIVTCGTPVARVQHQQLMYP
jgi:hypothetical protein